jgi:hypothetical protein
VTAPEITLRSAMLAAIIAQRDGSGYVNVPAFEAVESQNPSISLPETQETARVTVLGLSGDEERLSRSRTDPFYECDIPVQICVQKSVPADDTPAVDALISFVEELKRTASQLTTAARFAWQRTEALKDANGTPYDYVQLRENDLFHAIFTARFHYTPAMS